MNPDIPTNFNLYILHLCQTLSKGFDMFRKNISNIKRRLCMKNNV